jgi:hypothetical protein
MPTRPRERCSHRRRRHGRKVSQAQPMYHALIRGAPQDALSKGNAMDIYVPHSAPQRAPDTVSATRQLRRRIPVASTNPFPIVLLPSFYVIGLSSRSPDWGLNRVVGGYPRWRRCPPPPAHGGAIAPWGTTTVEEGRKRARGAQSAHLSAELCGRQVHQAVAPASRDSRGGGNVRPKSARKRNSGDRTCASVTVAPSPSRSTDAGIRAPHVRGMQLCSARVGERLR